MKLSNQPPVSITVRVSSSMFQRSLCITQSAKCTCIHSFIYISPSPDCDFFFFFLGQGLKHIPWALVTLEYSVHWIQAFSLDIIPFSLSASLDPSGFFQWHFPYETFPKVVISDSLLIELILVKCSHYRGGEKADDTLTRQEKFMLQGKYVSFDWLYMTSEIVLTLPVTDYLLEYYYRNKQWKIHILISSHVLAKNKVKTSSNIIDLRMF